MRYSLVIFSILFLSILAQAEPVGDVFSTDNRGWFATQWEKLKVQADASAGLDLWIVDGHARYKYTVQPAFVKGLHQRLDQWIAQLGADTDRINGSPISIGGKISAQVTFSRLFDSKDGALKKKPYYLNQIPWTHDKVLADLNEGDAFRLEAFTDGHVGLNKGSDHNHLSVGGHVSKQRDLRFLVDVYRMQGNRVRMRLIGEKNNGVFNFGMNFDPIHSMDYGTGVIRSLTNRLLRCSIPGIDGTKASMQDPPVDTRMVDYVFNLNSPEAQQAYDKVMSEIYHFDYKKMLTPWNMIDGRETSNERLLQEIFRYVDAAEYVFRGDRKNQPESRRVNRIFKGRARSGISGFLVKVDCAHLADLRQGNYSSRTLVENFDQNDQVSNQIFENIEITTLRSFVASIWEQTSKNSMNVLFDSDTAQVPTSMSDLVMTNETKDKDFKAGELKTLKAYLNYVLPEKISSQINWSPFEKDNKVKTNVSYRYDFIFHKEALEAIPSMDGREAYERLYKYIQKLPRREYLDVSVDPFSENGAQPSNYSMEYFQYDLNSLAPLLGRFFYKGNDVNTRAEAFAALRENVLFRQVGPGFLISLLPAEKADRLLAFRLNINGADNATVSYSNSVEGLSDTYKSIEYLLEMITEREFDIRLQVQGTGRGGLWFESHPAPF